VNSGRKLGSYGEEVAPLGSAVLVSKRGGIKTEGKSAQLHSVILKEERREGKIDFRPTFSSRKEKNQNEM